MPTVDSYNAKTISVNFAWPPEVTGIERIMLSAQGDLQRLLSAFFALPITVALLYSQTSSCSSSNSPPKPLTLPNTSILTTVSPQNPLVQTRRVNLLCADRIVCTATSTVRITCPKSAGLFIGEKYAIGQVFRELGKIPRFELIAVGIGGNIAGEESKLSMFAGLKKHELWRKYKIDCEGFECDILEVFPTREMFRRGNAWLMDRPYGETGSVKGLLPQNIHSFVNAVPQLRRRAVLLLVMVIGFLSVSFYTLHTHSASKC